MSQELQTAGLTLSIIRKERTLNAHCFPSHPFPCLYNPGLQQGKFIAQTGRLFSLSQCNSDSLQWHIQRTISWVFCQVDNSNHYEGEHISNEVSHQLYNFYFSMKLWLIIIGMPFYVGI